MTFLLYQSTVLEIKNSNHRKGDGSAAVADSQHTFAVEARFLYLLLRVQSVSKESLLGDIGSPFIHLKANIHYSAIYVSRS